MFELIYLGDSEPREQVEQAILKEFPQAVFGDASDFIHINRFQVEISGDEEENKRAFFRLAVVGGFALGCLTIHLALMQKEAWVTEELDRLKKEKEAKDGRA